MGNPLRTPVHPWDTRLGFFWYNDREIFHTTQADLNRQTEALAGAGINHALTFSCTHFRVQNEKYGMQNAKRSRIRLYRIPCSRLCEIPVDKA